MIRINLLPVKRSRRREAGQRQIVAMGAAVLAAVGGVVFVHISASNELDEVRRQNRTITADIDRLKAELGDYDKVVAQRQELLKQRKSIEALETGRTGPVFLLRELAEILTAGKGPSFDRILYEESLRRDPNVGFNATWDTKRVWLESFEEDDKTVKVRAAAKSIEDASEFLKRLQLSVFFSDVKPETTSQVTGTGANPVKHVSFSFTARVTY
jgi:type IV pilus assembly protein PilN